MWRYCRKCDTIIKMGNVLDNPHAPGVSAKVTVMNVDTGITRGLPGIEIIELTRCARVTLLNTGIKTKISNTCSVLMLRMVTGVIEWLCTYF